MKSQVVADTLTMVGANDTAAPPLPPANEAGARARLALTGSSPLPPGSQVNWQHGVEWLREGLLLPDGAHVPGPPPRTLPASVRRARNHWNDERVYTVNGVRVAVQASTARQLSALDQALGWWDASDEDTVDATLIVPPRTAPTEVVASMHRLALRRLGGVVRRRIAFASKGHDEVLIVGDRSVAARRFGPGWSLKTGTVVIGGPHGKTLRERAHLLISIAHPDFRAELTRDFTRLRQAPPGPAKRD